MDHYFLSADIAFGTAVAFLCGTLAAGLGWSAGAMIGIAAIGGVGFLLFAGGARRRTLKQKIWGNEGLGIAFMFAALAFGIFYYHFFLSWKAAGVHLPFNTKTTFQAVVVDEPQPSEKYTILTADALAPFSGTVKIFTPAAAQSGGKYGYGDQIKVSGEIQKPASAEDTSGGANDDPAVFSPRITLIARHRASRIREVLINIKEAILATYDEFLPDEQAELLGGITFGSKQNFSKELKNDMSLSGTTHLVAISGYNITIVIIAAGEIFGRVFPRRATFAITIALIILFILMTGLQSSAIRAGIMGFLALTAKQSGRASSMRNAIAITGALMVLWSPPILLDDAGFQLSFLSLVGIVVLSEPLKRLFRQTDPGFLDWKEQAIVTMSAQLGVLPVLIAAFGQFSLTAIGANVLVLGTVPLTMLFGFVLAGVGFASYSLSLFTARLAGILLGYQLGVIKLFAALAVPLPVAFSSALAVATYYAALAIFAFSYTTAGAQNNIGI